MGIRARAGLMATKRIPRPRDPVQLGKLMVDIMTGQVPDAVDDGKDAGAAGYGSQGRCRTRCGYDTGAASGDRAEGGG